MYQMIWEASIGEELPRKAEGENCSDRFAVAVVKDGIVVTTYGTLIERLLQKVLCMHLAFSHIW